MRVVGSILWLGALAVFPVWATPSYTIADLGSLRPDESVHAAALNDGGQIVGTSGPTGFLWQSGRMTDLGTLPNDMHLDFIGSSATAISRKGVVVGSSGSYQPVVMSGFQQSAAVLYANGRMKALAANGYNNVGCEADGVNLHGDVVGCNQHRAFLWSKGKWRELGPLSRLPAGNDCHASSINDSGWVVGASTVPASTRQKPVVHACLWRDGRPFDLGALPGQTASAATAINNRGWIVGSSGHHAVLWRAGQKLDLGLLPGCRDSVAGALNEDGAVVGTGFVSDTKTRAWLWQSGQVIDLNTLLPANSGWKLESATGINRRGQIVGDGELNGKHRAYLLDPVSPERPRASPSPRP